VDQWPRLEGPVGCFGEGLVCTVGRPPFISIESFPSTRIGLKTTRFGVNYELCQWLAINVQIQVALLVDTGNKFGRDDLAIAFPVFAVLDRASEGEVSVT
jgi:hypothetical protein